MSIAVGAVLALVILASVAGWFFAGHNAQEGEAAVPPSVAEARKPTRVRPLPTIGAASTAPATRAPRPIEYADDGVPIMPPGNDDPRPDGPVHPHPITPEHLRIFRENNLLGQLNGAMDAKDAAGLRRLLATYRSEYPDDPQQMQSGYGIIADCLDRPSAATRAVAQKYFDQERASTLRRFVLRHCLQPG